MNFRPRATGSLNANRSGVLAARTDSPVWLLSVGHHHHHHHHHQEPRYKFFPWAPVLGSGSEKDKTQKGPGQQLVMVVMWLVLAVVLLFAVNHGEPTNEGSKQFRR